jgi:alpha-beta hydrolase superfamily lysophospholipase
MPLNEWEPDLLVGFECCSFPLTSPDPVAGDPVEGLRAVLVRPVERPGGTRAVLYVHGWNDYFFQRHLAEFWAELGYDFYALDLRRYGRSRVEGQLLGYTSDLGEYDEELDIAVAELRAEHERLVLMGHSTGGLIAALYAHDRPGTFDAVVLNSPWLDLQGGPLARTLGSAIAALGSQRPTTVLPVADSGFYKRVLHTSEGGEWDYDLALKSAPTALIRVGWLKAVLLGHARIASGLAIDCPVLVMTSARSQFSRKWSEDLRTADIVLDVDQIAKRAVQLGPLVTMIRIDGGLHDLTLSAEPVRREVLGQLRRWVWAYATIPSQVWSAPDSSPVSTRRSEKAAAMS